MAPDVDMRPVDIAANEFQQGWDTSFVTKGYAIDGIDMGTQSLDGSRKTTRSRQQHVLRDGLALTLRVGPAAFHL